MRKWSVLGAGLVDGDRGERWRAGRGEQLSCRPARARSGAVSQDACQMAVDVFQLMSPQLGLALAGGNATLGQRQHAWAARATSPSALRANFFQGDLPHVDDFPTPSVTGRVASARRCPRKTQFVGLPTADAAHRHLPAAFRSALTNVGGIDLLLSATYVPSYRRRRRRHPDRAGPQPAARLRRAHRAAAGVARRAGRVVHLPQARSADDDA